MLDTGFIEPLTGFFDGVAIWDAVECGHKISVEYQPLQMRNHIKICAWIHPLARVGHSMDALCLTRRSRANVKYRRRRLIGTFLSGVWRGYRYNSGELNANG